jgi:hypothetical protein
MRIKSGQDDIFIWRRTLGACSWSMSSTNLSSEKTDAEWVAKAASKEGKYIDDDNELCRRHVWMDSGVCMLFANSSNEKTWKISLTFNGLENLYIRLAEKDETNAEIIVRPNATVPFFLNPINPGEDTTFRMPDVRKEVIDDDGEDQVDLSVLKWVEAIWSTYDADGNDELDKAEAWRFCNENMHGMITQANFQTTWELMDQDQSNSLCRSELA